MNHWGNGEQRSNQKQAGTTLLEMVLALGVTLLVAILALKTLNFYNTSLGVLRTSTEVNREAIHVRLYLQKQILSSEFVIVHNHEVYLQDMESADLGYYNHYRLTKGVLYREKVVEDTLKSIGSGAVSQFADGLSAFAMEILTDESGAYIPMIRLQIQWKDEETIDEIIIRYPGGREQIRLQ